MTRFAVTNVGATILQGGLSGVIAHSDAFQCSVAWAASCSGGSIAAGQTATIVLTSRWMTFYTPTTSHGTTTVTVDPDNLIPESTEANNVASL